MRICLSIKRSSINCEYHAIDHAFRATASESSAGEQCKFKSHSSCVVRPEAYPASWWNPTTSSSSPDMFVSRTTDWEPSIIIKSSSWKNWHIKPFRTHSIDLYMFMHQLWDKYNEELSRESPFTPTNQPAPAIKSSRMTLEISRELARVISRVGSIEMSLDESR